METPEKVTSTRERQAQQRREKIIQASMKLFWEKCVEDSSMEEVAKCSGVGVATIYRYFSTKIELVIETAEVYWQEVAEKYLTELEPVGTGYMQLQKIMNVLEKIFQEEKAFLKFLQEFDVFVKKYQISEERLTDYESGILRLKPYVTDALEKGLADESRFFTCSIDEMYFSLTHTLLAVMQKLAVGGEIISSDQVVEGERQFHIVTELLLRGIKG